MSLKHWKWKKIILRTVVVILMIDLVLIAGSVYLSESERGPNETAKYFGCGQTNDFTRRACLARDSQKEMIKELVGIPTRFEVQKQLRHEILERCVTPTGGPDLSCREQAYREYGL